MLRDNEFIKFDNLPHVKKLTKEKKETLLFIILECLCNKNPIILKIFLKRISPNTTIGNDSLLEKAVANNNFTAVEILVDKGARIDHDSRESILSRFFEKLFNEESIKILKLLLEKGVNLDKKCKNEYGEERTALEIFEETLASHPVEESIKITCYDIINSQRKSKYESVTTIPESPGVTTIIDFNPKKEKSLYFYPRESKTIIHKMPGVTTTTHFENEGYHFPNFNLPSFLESDSDEERNEIGNKTSH